MTVTKQQQLEWLAHKYKTWPEQGATSLGLSVAEVGKFAIVNSHVVTRQEWQQERDKMSSKPEVTNSWHERGELPPVGCVCLYVVTDRCSYEVEITAHSKFGICFVRVGELAEFYISKSAELHRFRPPRTEREKATDALIEIICANGFLSKDGTEAREIAERIYDAGMLK